MGPTLVLPLISSEHLLPFSESRCYSHLESQQDFENCIYRVCHDINLGSHNRTLCIHEHDTHTSRRDLDESAPLVQAPTNFAPYTLPIPLLPHNQGVLPVPTRPIAEQWTTQLRRITYTDNPKLLCNNNYTILAYL